LDNFSILPRLLWGLVALEALGHPEGPKHTNTQSENLYQVTVRLV